MTLPAILAFIAVACWGISIVAVFRPVKPRNRSGRRLAKWLAVHRSIKKL